MLRSLTLFAALTGLVAAQRTARPQRRRATGLAAARFLPKETLLSAQLVGAQRLAQLAQAIDQVALLQSPRIRAFLEWTLRTDGSMRRGLDGLMRVKRVLELFDRGTTMLAVYGENQRQPNVYFVGATSKAANFRGIDDTLARLLGASEPARGKFTRKLTPLADSPVSARSYTQPVSGGGGWRQARLAQWAVKGRLLAAHASTSWNPVVPDGDETKDILAPRLEVLGQLLGVIPGGGPGNSVTAQPPAADGDLLGRMNLRWRATAQKHASDRDKEEFRRVGIWGFDGVDGVLSHKDGTAIERLELRCNRTEKPSLFDGLKPNQFGLGDAGAALPKYTLGALRLAFDGAHVTKWSYAASSRGATPDRDLVQFYRFCRPMFGLPASATNEGVEEMRELTIALLPPAPGSLAPEPLILSRQPTRENEVLGALRGMYEGIGGLHTKGKFEIKTLGKGDDAIRYVALKKLFGTRDSEMNMALGLLGGGFVSAQRIGPFLMVGCNPRTMRKLRRAVAKGETLGSDPDFTRRFPTGSKRVLEGFFDWPEIVKTLRAIDMMASATAMVDSPAGDVPPVPSRREILGCVHKGYVTSAAAEFGHVFTFEGSTLLSPTLWTATGLAGIQTEDLGRLLR